MTQPTVDLRFPHAWQAEILGSRPLILPPRRFVYPAQAEEVERGALEVLVRPDAPVDPQTDPKCPPSAQEFLATCALGFADPAVPSGLWSCPNPNQLCDLRPHRRLDLVRLDLGSSHVLVAYSYLQSISCLP